MPPCGYLKWGHVKKKLLGPDTTQITLEASINKCDGCIDSRIIRRFVIRSGCSVLDYQLKK